MEKDVKIFGEIYLDNDTDPKINKGSDYILNSIIQSDGRFGMIVNSKGNQITTDAGLFDSTFGVNNFVALNQTTRNWSYITVTFNNNVYVTVNGGDIYKQTGGTGDFVALSQTERNWTGITSLANGNIYAASYGGAYGDDIYMQTGGTGDFVATGQTHRNWIAISTAPNGNVYACEMFGDIYKQTGGTGDFVALGQTNREWTGITVAPNGNVYACVYIGDIYKQTGGTGDFVALSQTTRAWIDIAAAPNGNIYATVQNGDIYKQTNGTGNFTTLSQGNKNWLGITCAPNGNIYACVYGGDIYKRQYINTVKVIGSCKDEARGRIIYFTANYVSGSYTSAIFYYEIETGENKLILNASYLNFTYTSNITAHIIGDLLLWTDGVNPPRKINYIRAYNYTNSINTDYIYATLSDDIIEAYKRPPSVPIIGGASFSIYQTTSLSNNNYQFSYRYVYSDYEKSVLTAYSDVFFTESTAYPDGSKLTYSNAFSIELYFYLFNTINSTYDDIDSIELFVRNGDERNWYLYDKIYNPKLTTFSLTYNSSGSIIYGGVTYSTTRGTVSESVYNKLVIGLRISYNSNYYYIREKYISGTNYIIGITPTISGTGWTHTFTITGYMLYLFYDDKIKQEVDQTDLLRPYDYLPKLAGTQEIIEKDKIIYGDITEGFDNIDVNIDTTIVKTTITYNTNVVSYTNNRIGSYYYLTFNSYPINTLFYVIVKRSRYPSTAIYQNFEYQSYYVSKSGDTAITILTALKNNLIASGVFASTLSVSSSSPYYLKLQYEYDESSGSIPNIFSFYYVKTTSINYIYKTMPHNNTNLGGIQYFDENLRYSSIQKFNSAISTGDKTSHTNVFSLSCSIKNKPPTWAYYYSLCFTKSIQSEILFHLYYYFSNTLSNITVTDFYSYFSNSDNYLRIAVNKLITDSTDINPHLKLNTYDFQEGDRIKIYTSSLTYYDYEIKDVEWPKTDDRYKYDYATTPSYITDSDGNKVVNSYSQLAIIPATRLDLSSLTITKYYVFGTPGNTETKTELYAINQELHFEIYRPKKQSSNPLYFPIYFGTIGNPGTTNNYHKGTSQNQNPSSPVSTPAVIECNPGDLYLKLRFAKYIYPALDKNYSDYYESNSYGFGLPNVYNVDAKEEELTSSMRYSGSLLEDTKINRLNVFKSEDLETLKSKFGTIHSLREVGNVMKVLQDKKETSIYISRTEMQNADNTSNVVKSTALLGTANKYDEDRGTVYPNSVIVHNRNIYYFDVYRAELIRSAPNGQYPVSEYGMRTYFKQKAQEILNAGIDNCKLLAAFDEENKMYLLTIITTESSQTIGFYDPEIEGAKPRWLSFYSFIPEHYSSLGTTLLSFNEGNGFKHNSSEVNRTTFYGVKYNQQINWYTNALPTIKKIFKSLIIKSNIPWDIPTITSESDSTYHRGIQSLLQTNHFILREGVFYASYLNNMLTSSSVANVIDLVNGDTLRANYLKHEMENSENDETWLIDGEVQYDPSNKY